MTRTGYVLDTSALLAHALSEPGWEIVERLIEEHPRHLSLSAITWLEFNIHILAIVSDPAEAEEILLLYRDLLAEAVPATRETAEAALALRFMVPHRLPNSDALIAATAQLRSATLVHRDPHLAAIPATLVKQIVLPDKATAQPTRTR